METSIRSDTTASLEPERPAEARERLDVRRIWQQCRETDPQHRRLAGHTAEQGVRLVERQAVRLRHEWHHLTWLERVGVEGDVHAVCAREHVLELRGVGSKAD